MYISRFTGVFGMDNIVKSSWAGILGEVTGIDETQEVDTDYHEKNSNSTFLISFHRIENSNLLSEHIAPPF